MKTSKIVLIATFVAFAMVSLAKTGDSKPKLESSQIVNISFDQAMQNPMLVISMHQQIDLNLIGPGSSLTPITIEVNYLNSHVLITGTYSQWVGFLGPPIFVGKNVHFE